MKVTMVAVVTIDGKLARNSAHFSDWSSREDKKIFVSLTKRAGVMIIGHNTYQTLPAPLPGRLHVVLTREAANKEDIPGLVEFTDQQPEDVLAGLEARSYTEAVLGGGSQINALFLQRGLVDEISLTIEPIVFGTGIDLLEGMELDLRARLLEVERLNEGGTVWLRYALDRTPGQPAPGDSGSV
nr:RibD C-terminal domain protein [uncultured bacterium]